MQNNNSKLNTWLLVILVILAGICTWKLVDRGQIMGDKYTAPQEQLQTSDKTDQTDFESENLVYTNTEHNFSIDLPNAIVTETSSPGMYYFAVESGIKSMRVSIYKSFSVGDNNRLATDYVDTVTYNGIEFEHRQASAEGSILDMYFFDNEGVMYLITTKYPELLAGFSFLD